MTINFNTGLPDSIYERPAMTPAQVAHIMELVDAYLYAPLKQKREAIEAALRDAPQSENFIVSVVVIKDHATGINTQNKLYAVQAVSQEEAHGKAMALWPADFPEHRFHTICAHPVFSAPTAVEPDERAKNKPKREPWICLQCLSDRPGHHRTLDDKVTPCPNGAKGTPL